MNFFLEEFVVGGNKKDRIAPSPACSKDKKGEGRDGV